MERNIHTDEFERFLRDKADQYKVYPSDKIWSNINRSIHPRKKWPYAALTLFLLLGTAVFIDYNSFNYIVPGKQPLLAYSHNNHTIPAATPSFISDRDKSKNNSIYPADDLSQATAAITGSDTKHSLGLANISKLQQETKPADGKAHSSNEISTTTEHITDNQGDLSPLNSLVASSNASSSDANSGDEKGDDLTNTKKKLWGGEVYRPSRFKWQLSFSPTISYRRLTSGIGQITDVFRGVPYSTVQSNTSVNDLVAHKPAIGAEVGASLIYKVSNNFTLRGGLQLNYSRYQLNAYNSKPEIATLALHNKRGGTDSVNFVTTLENHEGHGSSSSWLNNEYLQISLPVGFEWSVLGNETLKWNIAANAQPVYNFANNVYLLSTDFKYYVQDPSLIRKWNINAGIETFVSYDMGSFKWQVGPQLRYQLMSSYKNAYPIKEYLVDFGFKIGVTKTF
ncbi:MAG: hypothetical protein J0H29_08695 [Sphingobacteriales bacterium]|nr:hypothetical protein [Sphingobacteriales bacterium]OJY92593.1 MAG: hypothetical protein BGP14_15610 [Sphingobacteriales bacterium 44-15]